MPLRPLIQLTGGDYGSPPYDARPGGFFQSNIYPCVLSGLATVFRLYSNSTGTVQYGIYSGDTVPPTNQPLLTGVQSYTAVTGAQWNDLALSTPYAVVSSSDYTVAAQTASSGVVSSQFTTGAMNYFTSASSLPSTSPSSLTSRSDRNLNFEVLGWIDPSISGVNSGASIEDGDTSVLVAGNDAMPSQGAGYVTLANNADWDTATIKVTQTIDSWADGSIYIDVVQGGLSAGTVYAFITTDLGLRNDTGFAVTLDSGTSYPTGTMAGTLPAVQGDADADVVRLGVMAGTLPAVQGDADADVVRLGTMAGTLPAVQGDADADVVRVGTMAGTLPAVQGDADADVVRVGTMAGTLPAVQGDADADVVRVGTMAGTLPAVQGDGVGTVPGGDPTGTMAGTLPAVQGDADADVVRVGTMAGTLPAVQGDGVGTVPSEYPTGTMAGTLPAVQGDADADVVRLGTMAGTLPAVQGDGVGTVPGGDPTGTMAGTLPAVQGFGVGGHVTPPRTTPIPLHVDDSVLQLSTDDDILKVIGP